jgi:mannose-1-phosphate guanylyltransferase/mannose-6-phosphate isomerase
MVGIMKQLKHSYIVIMAGGSGTRLWPLSRQKKPKQFQSFVSSKTLIQETFERAAQVVPKENIFVSTAQKYKSLVLEQLPALTEKRLILEPQPRNTAPAISLTAAAIAMYDKNAVIATIASDHAIDNPEEFVKTISLALVTVAKNRDKLITIGINPARPDTGLGYIKIGKEFLATDDGRIFVVDAFKEKPDLATAEKYLSNWEYLWNAGYFIFAVESFAKWTKQHSPSLHQTIEKIVEYKNSSAPDEKIMETLYEETPNEPFDTLIVEKLSPKDRLVIPSSLRWNDVGGWENLYGFLSEKNGSKMITRGKYLDIDSQNSLIYGHNKLIATIGLEDLVIVDTDDAILIARRDQVSAKIKKLLEKMKKEGEESYL